MRYLSPVQTDVIVNGRVVDQQLPSLLDAKCCVRLHTLLHVVACCCAKFATGQTFQPTTPNISFVPWSPKRSATMLDPFAQLFQHCWGHAREVHMIYKGLWVFSFSRYTAGPNCFLGAVASVCTPLPTHTQQLPTLLRQQCWELLRPFVRNFTINTRLHYWLLTRYFQKISTSVAIHVTNLKFVLKKWKQDLKKSQAPSAIFLIWVGWFASTLKLPTLQVFSKYFFVIL